MNRLVALDLAGGPEFLRALRRAWDDRDAVFPIDQRLPIAARDRVLVAMAPAAIVDAAGEHPRTKSRPVEPGDALVIASSGTTGTPKGAVLTHEAVWASAAASSAYLGVTSDDHWLACLPLAHVGGLSVITKALHAGTRLTVLPGFDAATVEAAGATLTSLVPTALSRIDAQRFRSILLGGSRIPAERPVNCVATYGLTETGSGVVYDGYPLADVEVRIDDGGQILLRCPMLLRAYRDGTDPRDSEGWFPTGDLGELADDGRLTVFGRTGDLIITGGENVWPEPVEWIVQTVAGVADAAVTGRPDPEWGHVVVAWIVPADPTNPPSLDRVRDAVKDQLPAFCAPRRLVVCDSIPRTALGKIQRSMLKEDP